jgi:hypothetical protein
MQLPKYRHNYLATQCKNANILDAYVPIFKTKILPRCSISFSSSIHQEDSPLVFCTSEDLHIMSIVLAKHAKRQSYLCGSSEPGCEFPFHLPRTRYQPFLQVLLCRCRSSRVCRFARESRSHYSELE